jgi:hypothetical protein
MRSLFTRPHHRLRRSPSPVNGGGTAFIKGATRFLPCEAGEGDHAKHGGGGGRIRDGGIT